jgi:hypothetical protein
MATEARIRELDSRHTELDARIASAQKSPTVDSLQIAALKKKKLKIKEELEDLRRRK